MIVCRHFFRLNEISKKTIYLFSIFLVIFLVLVNFQGLLDYHACITRGTFIKKYLS
jgi:hypothetical protein